MKILMVTPYITSSAHPQFLKNQTGLGYMVHDIAESIAKNNSVDVFTLSALTPSMTIEGFNILGRNWWKIATSIRMDRIKDFMSFINKYSIPLKGKMRTLYYYCAMGQIERIVSNYDIVHIHGCSPITDACINICKRKKTPVLITLHGLISFEECIQLSPSMKQYERDFLKQSLMENIPITFISTGIIRQVCGYLRKDNIKNFHIITNGCDVSQYSIKKIEIRKIYSISDTDFLFVCIGNISERKNQLQSVKAYLLLSSEERKYIKILFVGKYEEQDPIVKFIADNNLAKQLILCGPVPKSEIRNYYMEANATILTSISEGFGLSIIEGFTYGLPNLTFADLPAVPDLYNEEAMVTINERSDKALARGMQEVVMRKWDNGKIATYAQQFSFANMAANYKRLYRRIIAQYNE